jgi:hypothetical protein
VSSTLLYNWTAGYEALTLPLACVEVHIKARYMISTVEYRVQLVATGYPSHRRQKAGDLSSKGFVRKASINTVFCMTHQISYNAAVKRDGCTEEVVFAACL